MNVHYYKRQSIHEKEENISYEVRIYVTIFLYHQSRSYLDTYVHMC